MNKKEEEEKKIEILQRENERLRGELEKFHEKNGTGEISKSLSLFGFDGLKEGYIKFLAKEKNISFEEACVFAEKLRAIGEKEEKVNEEKYRAEILRQQKEVLELKYAKISSLNNEDIFFKESFPMDAEKDGVNTKIFIDKRLFDVIERFYESNMNKKTAGDIFKIYLEFFAMNDEFLAKEILDGFVIAIRKFQGFPTVANIRDFFLKQVRPNFEWAYEKKFIDDKAVYKLLPAVKERRLLK